MHGKGCMRVANGEARSKLAEHRLSVVVLVRELGNVAEFSPAASSVGRGAQPAASAGRGWTPRWRWVLSAAV